MSLARHLAVGEKGWVGWGHFPGCEGSNRGIDLMVIMVESEGVYKTKLVI